MGFPFLTGFYSKDVILELAYAKYTVTGHFAHWLGTLAAFFTAFYSFRLIYLTFLSEPNGFKNVMVHAHDAPAAMALPLATLALGSMFTGYYTKDMIIGVGTDFWGNAIYTLPENMILLEAEFIPTSIKLVPVIFSITGAITSFLVYAYFSKELYQMKVSFVGRKIYTFLNRKWFFDKVYNEYIVQGALTFGYQTSYKAVDRGLIEMLGPYGISHSIYNTSMNISKMQSGYLYHYAFVMLLGVIAFTLTLSLSSFVDIRLYTQFIATGLLYLYFNL